MAEIENTATPFRQYYSPRPLLTVDPDDLLGAAEAVQGRLKRLYNDRRCGAWLFVAIDTLEAWVISETHTSMPSIERDLARGVWGQRLVGHYRRDEDKGIYPRPEAIAEAIAAHLELPFATAAARRDITADTILQALAEQARVPADELAQYPALCQIAQAIAASLRGRVLLPLTPPSEQAA
ncbi:hypothetical protein [Pseudoxanthomonas winnipegensis]|uniref:hypothetical protein n=1 Tax=Pseudoxanthomonas winnipegensis TaxID=2480810 RepID=UPI00102D6EE2|nr:hypothetical protein [Pseudoxanthomonas winnipegensis]RZZ85675.1 hypothetical protein EA663_11740 [Pseudoxanthomonas winnipegensis]